MRFGRFFQTLPVFCLGKGGVQDFHGMQGTALRGIFDLMATACARCGDEGAWVGRTNGGEKDEFSNLLREGEVFDFIAEGSRHTTASGWDEVDLVPCG